MISVPEELSLINKHTPISETHLISINDRNITDSIIFEDIYVDINTPNFRATIFNVYTVYYTDGLGVYKVFQVLHASLGEKLKFKKVEVARFSTDSPIPDGSTAVMTVEKIEFVSSKNEELEENESENFSSKCISDR